MPLPPGSSGAKPVYDEVRVGPDDMSGGDTHLSSMYDVSGGDGGRADHTNTWSKW